ncbi:MAG TPA: hypothetical protein VFK44_06285 [Bacillales bacterium]|nr:hypothetical protein [Bacillales bacterium]
MLEMLFNLSNDPFLCMMTVFVLANLSGITVWVFLNKQCHLPIWIRCQSDAGRENGSSFNSDPEWIAGLLTIRMSTHIRRKECPQDDKDDHFRLVIC